MDRGGQAGSRYIELQVTRGIIHCFGAFSSKNGKIFTLQSKIKIFTSLHVVTKAPDYGIIQRSARKAEGFIHKEVKARNIKGTEDR